MTADEIEAYEALERVRKSLRKDVWDCKCDERGCPYCSPRRLRRAEELLLRIQKHGYDPLWRIADDVNEYLGSTPSGDEKHG